MTIIGNSLSMGGKNVSDVALLRVNTNTSVLASVTVTKGSYRNSASLIYRDADIGNYCYYFTIPSSEFSSNPTDVFTIAATATGYSGSSTVLITSIQEYDVDVIFVPETYILFGADDAPIKGSSFTSIQGAASKQTDTLLANASSVEYTEKDNDYGGIAVTTGIIFAGYNTLHIDFNKINSWQAAASSPGSSFYYARVYLMQGTYDKTDSEGFLSSTTYSNIYANGGNFISNQEIDDWTWELPEWVKTYTSPLYIHILVASGTKSGAGNGELLITKIWLTK